MSKEQLEYASAILGIIQFVFYTGGGIGVFQGIINSRSDDEQIANKGKNQLKIGFGIIAISIIFTVIVISVARTTVPSTENTPISETTERNSLAETQNVSETISSSTYKDNYVYPDGNIYTGNVNNAGKPDGKGKMIYIKGDTYDGEWKDGVRNGYGIYTWNGGAKYEGDYVNGVREGTGKYLNYVDPDGRFSGDYHGEFKNNQFEGEGVFYFTNGEKFMGIFKANQRWSGTQYNADGEVLWEIENGEPMP